MAVSPSLTNAARAVLAAADPFEKLRLTQVAAASWHVGILATIGDAAAPDRPARPARPELRRPGDMPKRRAAGSRGNRIALLHALAHIELNAIDLAWDMIARFSDPSLPRDFAADWLSVAAEEAKHFGLLSARLAELEACYGDLPAHDGLWEAAETTRDDLLARLAVVPLVLEARGLDVTPTMIASLTRAGDEASAAVLQTIYEEEIGHVAIGWRWFRHVAAAGGLDPDAAWPDLVRQHFRGRLKPPFNERAREAAGFAEPLYADLA
ncbi:MAG: ferritin-like domain-containing protein [Dongiaceae bacterium]